MKSNLVDILNVLYSKEPRELRTENIYSKSLENIYVDALNRKLFGKVIEKESPITKISTELEEISAEKELKEQELEKEIYVK